MSMFGMVRDKFTDAKIVTVIQYVPETLFFDTNGRTWLSGHIIIGGKKIGESHAEDFTIEEKEILRKIVDNAVQRHHKKIQEYGGN